MGVLQEVMICEECREKVEGIIIKISENNILLLYYRNDYILPLL